MSRAQRERDRERKKCAREASRSQAYSPVTFGRNCSKHQTQGVFTPDEHLYTKTLGFNDVPYSPSALADLIGNGDTEIPDDIIIAALNLIKSMCNNPQQQFIGYFTPSEIIVRMNVTTTEASAIVKQTVPDGQFSVNIHPLPNHWVTSCYDPQKNRVSVYDSLMSQTHYQQVIPQLKMVYGEKNASNVHYCQVTQQGSEPLCGVMAICFAFSLFLGKDPEFIEFDCGKARNHLRQCLLHGQIKEFPQKTNNPKCSLSGRTSSVNSTAVTDNLQKYFEDQHRRGLQHQRQMTHTDKDSSQTKPGDSDFSMTTLEKNDTKGEEFQSSINKKTEKQRKWRQKQREFNLEAARNKESKLKKRQRQKHRDTDLEAARTKRAKEQNKVRQKQRDTDLETATNKQSVIKNKQRQKHRETDLEAAKTKRAKEQNKVRQKQRDTDLETARNKQSVIKNKQRQKHRETDLEAAKTKRAKELNKVRQKHRDTDLEAAKTKRAKEQNKVRQKHRDTDLEAAKTKRAKEQNKVRQKHRDTDLEAARNKRSKYQQDYRTRELDMQTASIKFTKHINEFPEYVCTCCSRMLYKRSVVVVSSVSFKNASSELLTECLSQNVSAENKEWLCQTCLRYIRKNKMPPQSDANDLKLPPIPEELRGLSTLEERLLSQRYPFMKMLALPKGRQNAIKGAVVNIPVDMDTVTEMLPRTPTQAGFVPLKLKRKSEYKGHYSFQYVRPDNIRSALQWLLLNNVLYSNVKVNDTWEGDCEEDDRETWNELTGNTKENDDSNVHSLEVRESEEGNSDISEDSSDDTEVEDIVPISADPSQNVQFETCVQPTDMSIDANRILSIAPGEGKRPLAILQDNNFEELSFPTLFPSGKFGYTYQRPVNISVKKYFQRRILENGGQFASNIEYLFVAQFLTEWHQILSSMSVALRKSRPGQDGTNYNAAFFKNRDHMRPLLTKDDAYRFLQPIRGSPPYWQKVMYQLLAAVKQLKIFTWFLTLSAADMRWPDTLKALARQQRRSLTDEEIDNMTWEERCTLLRSNPTTAARHFHNRVQSLFTDVILSSACPLGKITRYFYRIEFQQRGSPHVHAILWVEDAPQPDAPSEDICSFVDTYIQASRPRDDDELSNLVRDLQTHSHTSTCTKRGGVCRFSFPKPVSEKTILSRPQHDEHEVKNRRASIEVLSKVKDCLQDQDSEDSSESVKDVLQKCSISPQVYYQALENATKTPTVFLKRDPCEICINQYNPSILRLWKANTDLQFVTSPYAAIAYITSYITKDEREVGTVLQAVSKEMRNQQIKEQMKKVAFAFSNARNVSAQEAAYRILGLPLYSSNITTVWIPSGLPENRIRVLKPKDQLDALNDDDENVFSANIIDRYSARPTELKDMCLAEFAMWYQSKSMADDGESDKVPDNQDEHTASDHEEVNNNRREDVNIISIKGHGKMKKRLSPAVIRYHQCSEAKDPELYAYNRMLLFMPWTDEKMDLLQEFETYSDHYESRKMEIENRFKLIMKNEELVQEAMSQYQEHGPPRHAWDDIAPETVHTEEVLIEEGYESDENFAILDPESTENAIFTDTDNSSSVVPRCVLEVDPDLLNDTDYRELVQSLNFQQRAAFQHILNWAVKQTRHSTRVIEPEYLFITGGAGTGKSHLISAIFNMVNRELRQAGEDPTKPKILLMAPTGTAAFNIGGLTVHSALQLPPKIDETYHKLSDSTCNRLRAQLSNLRIIIIDEISMVSGVCFNYIDKRLQQIKDSTSPFGGVMVLAVGDLYQLRPIGKYVFEPSSNIMNRLAGSEWQKLFRTFQLEEVMRQKDDADFALLLNRVRKGKHIPSDIRILQDRTIKTTDPQYNRNALHIFATNVQTNKHNNERLRELGQPIILLTRRERKPASLQDHSVSDNASDSGGLVKILELCKDARVMIVRNIDVQDGLVNGAQGQIIDFVPNLGNVHTVLVKFDRPSIGQAARASSPLDLSLSDKSVVPIKRVDVSFSTSSKKSTGPQITWTQFPLRLSFACTIHKVQGLSVDELVVSFQERFSGGQAYVALSRCRTLQGLQLLDFDEKKITQSSKVQTEMTRLQQTMPVASPYSCLQEPLTCEVITLGLLNARSLRLHFADIVADPIYNFTQLLFFTETNMYENQSCVHTIPGYSSIRKPQDHNCNHHGLACYFRDSFQCQQVQLPQTEHLETLGVQLQIQGAPSINFVLIYRSPSISRSDLLADLETLLKSDEYLPHSLILGDFNIDAIGPNYQVLDDLMEKYYFKFKQAKTSHRLGSCLDHVYLSKNMQELYSNCTYHPTYFSDHLYVTMQFEKPQ